METLLNKDDTVIHLQVLTGIDEAPSDQWDRLVRANYPFLKSAFLGAMERFDCVGEDVGWIPKHLCYFQNKTMLAAMPLYEKHNSWGEFVFDHAWADAYHRHGIEYYPKLLNAIPFTPATGQRLLTGDRGSDEANRETAQILISGARKLVEQGKYSGVHCLFPDATDFDLMSSPESVFRTDCQFHWHNKNYGCFDDFLSTLKSRKKKKIRQERRKVKDSGLSIRWIDGNETTEQDWTEFTRVYRQIYDRKYGMPAFNQSFFMDVAEAMPDQVQLVLAENQGTVVAGALMYCDDTTLYGRHWGCNQYVDSLHFELCYYQGIEFCIRNGLKKFDPGAQGEHKIARGFLPTATRSLHWMAYSPFNSAIRQFVEHEQKGVQQYIDAVAKHSPYNCD